MTDNTQITVQMTGPRPTSRPEPHPAPIPPEAMIMNGPRPLLGTVDADGQGLTWRDEAGPAGVYFAAILPDDPAGPDWHETNLAFGAKVVEFVPSGAG
jgi:hypothetical protein